MCKGRAAITVGCLLALLLGAGCSGDDEGGQIAVAPSEGDTSQTTPGDTGEPAPDEGPAERDPGAEELDEGEPTDLPADAAADGAEVEPDAEEELPELRFDAIFPARGKVAGGQTVSLLGEGFEQVVAVFFDATPCSRVILVSPTRLQVTTPAHEPGRVSVTVQAEDGRILRNEDVFLYYHDVRVDAVEPARGPVEGGTPLVVYGSGFVQGSTLIVGHSRAIDVQALDDGTILGLAPPGEPGSAHVLVSNELGQARLRHGYHYTAAPRLAAVVPGAGAAAGGELVELRGERLSGVETVWFGSMPAAELQPVDDRVLRVLTPAHAPGRVDLRVDGEQGSAALRGAFTFEEAAPTYGIRNVAPDRGPTEGGTEVAVTAPDLGTAEDTEVLFGGVPGEVVGVAEQGGVVFALTPARAAPGPVEVQVRAPGVIHREAGAFTYEPGLRVDSVEPGDGPLSGGTPVVVRGEGFGPDSEVLVGALAAAEVRLEEDGSISALTPPGSPGYADLRVRSAGRSAALPDAFFYASGEVELFAVTPDRGSVAGGTVIHLLGGGFTEEMTVKVGDSEATELTLVDSTHLWARTPPGAIGTVDVHVEGGAVSAKLERAYSYYDPSSTFGGTWGEEIESAVNITVLNGATAEPLPEVFVMMGSDTGTPYRGFTDAAGQITFSGPDVGGRQMITAVKEGFETFSVVEFDAENVTVFLQIIPEPSFDFPPGIAPPIVKGNVFGFGKYVVGQPGTCYGSREDDPAHCRYCDDDEDCGDQGGRCFDIGGDQGRRCLMACAEDADCPERALCRNFGSGHHCVPTPGHKVAGCVGSKPGVFVSSLNPGPAAMVNEQGQYTIIVWPGEIAIVCVGGFWTRDDPPSSEALLDEIMYPGGYGTFIPVSMGISRHNLLAPGDIAFNVDVDLNIPLTYTRRIRVDNPPVEDMWSMKGRIYLELGSDGVFQMPVVDRVYDDEPLSMAGQPRELTGDIADAAYTIWATAWGWGSRSDAVRWKITRPEDDRMLRMVEGTWGLVGTGVSNNLHDAWAAGPMSMFTVGTDGAIYHFNGSSYSRQSSDTGRTLRGIHGTGADDVWVVGDKGIVFHFEGLSWERESSGTSRDLRAVFTPGGHEVWAAGSHVLAHRDSLGTWTEVPGMGHAWHDIHGTGPDDIWIVGNRGRVQRYDGERWSIMEVPTTMTLRAVLAVADDDVWFAGEAGTVIHYDGVEHTVAEPKTALTLTGLAARGPNEVYAVGGRGTVLAYDGAVWLEVPVSDYNQQIHAVVAPKGSSAVFTFGDHELSLGPMVPIAHVEVPEDGGVMEESLIRWTASTRVEPHYQWLSIVIPGLFDIPVWGFITDGTTREVPFPDLDAIPEAGNAIPASPLKLNILRSYQEGFDIDHFDYSEISIYDRQAWSVTEIDFIKLGPPDEGEGEGEGEGETTPPEGVE